MTRSKSASAKFPNFLWNASGSWAGFYIISTRRYLKRQAQALIRYHETKQRGMKGNSTLTASPKNTISGFTNPLHRPHLGIFSSWIDFLISAASKGALQSMQPCDAKLPWASTSFSLVTPARLSRVSMFWVKQVPKRPLISNKRTNECVMVGRCLPGYSSFARA